ncbi:MAG: 2-amino-4-hydroxy-6-hydroxymethyldihydropteridine diphosphokinase [Novosphingobium sp.]|nr:2-amino-4-hydroxy-6-hydroxymethyldihydropteridine diphosphokinase [Novosphingobium sp.]MCP5404060.1 2-amino-4-hydroxy-6-hydroxymethyldihydropteridine diphosphokinase [Novosphingobium sp.]
MAKKQRYLIAMGSNVRHARHGRPRDVLAAACKRLDADGVKVKAVAPVVMTAPLGPSLRRYANGAVVVKTKLKPDELMDRLGKVERDFGPRRRGQRWRARVLDLDIVLWEGGAWASTDLIVPHADFRSRDFVLRPSAAIAGDWRDPVTNLTLRHIFARLTRPRPTPR